MESKGYQKRERTLPATERLGTRCAGSIRKIDHKAGFGFIAGDDGIDYFFHWSSLYKDGKNFRELVVQERLEFEICVNDEGPRAIKVRVEEA